MPQPFEKRDHRQYAISLGFTPEEAETLKRWMKTRIKSLAEYRKMLNKEARQ